MSRPHLPPGMPARYNYSIVSRKLPESFSGFKIAHISDPHSRPAKGVFEIVAEAKPDITVITGDLFNDDELPTTEIDGLLFRLLEISPVYFISGNHDLWRMGYRSAFSEYEKQGAVYLDGKTEIIRRGADAISLSGASDPFSRVPHSIKKNTEENMKNLSLCCDYNILLFHRANLFDLIKNKGFDLILSGHMHGGQIRIPGIGGLLAPSSAMLSKTPMLFPKYTGGTVAEGDTTMIVNRGIGNTLPLPRLGNPPEVGIITLLRQ